MLVEKKVVLIIKFLYFPELGLHLFDTFYTKSSSIKEGRNQHLVNIRFDILLAIITFILWTVGEI